MTQPTKFKVGDAVTLGGPHIARVIYVQPDELDCGAVEVQWSDGRTTWQAADELQIAGEGRGILTRETHTSEADVKPSLDIAPLRCTAMYAEAIGIRPKRCDLRDKHEGLCRFGGFDLKFTVSAEDAAVVADLRADLDAERQRAASLADKLGLEEYCADSDSKTIAELRMQVSDLESQLRGARATIQRLRDQIRVMGGRAR